MNTKTKRNTITNASRRFELPMCVNRDDIIHGQIDIAATRRREEAERKRLIGASQKPYRPAPRCNHARPVRTHTFSDGKVLELYGCGCSNGAEILNGRKACGARNQRPTRNKKTTKVGARRARVESQAIETVSIAADGNIKQEVGR